MGKSQKHDINNTADSTEISNRFDGEITALKHSPGYHVRTARMAGAAMIVSRHAAQAGKLQSVVHIDHRDLGVAAVAQPMLGIQRRLRWHAVDPTDKLLLQFS